MTNQRIMGRPMRAGLAAAAVAVSVMLAGCASTLSANVTSFQQWPAGVEGQSYQIAKPSGDQNALEYSAYQDMLRAAIGPTGLVEASGGQAARFAVSFRYMEESTQIIRREAADPYFYGGWGYGGPWWWGGYYGPSWVAVPENAWRNSLTVEIRDNSRNGAEVYRSTASTLSSDQNAMPRVMPYLMQAVFDGFPGNNGQVRELRYRRD